MIKLELLKEITKDLFRAHSAKDMLIEQIKANIKHISNEKHKDLVCWKKDEKFEFLDTRAAIYSYTTDLEFPKVDLTLCFTTTKKLRKYRSDKLKEFKTERRCGRNGTRYYTEKPIWIYMDWELSIEEALTGNYNLKLDD